MFASRHLRETGMSYGTHMRHALSVSLKLFQAAAVAAVHGLLPNLFETRASELVAELNDNLRRVGPKGG